MSLIYIGAGSNQGKSLEYLQLAAQLLAPAVQIRRTSGLYLTEPWGYKEQPPFYNLVWEAETQLPPQSLLKYFKEIEQRLGRVKTLRYGPRVIDLDILLYDELIFQSKNLTIPHLQIPNRRFVLQPLCDLIPDGKDPRSGKSWRQFLDEAPQEKVQRLEQQLPPARSQIRWGMRTYVMGIVNLTPDSFSGDGLLKGNVADSADSPARIAQVIQQCAQFLDQGVDILDLGAQSTRPGYTPVSAEEELRRLLPALREVRQSFPQALLSVDSDKAEVFRSALDCGTDWINNTGRMNDADLCKVCASAHKPLILMRFQPLSQNSDEALSPEKVMERVRIELMQFMENMLRAGARSGDLILDPGLGFGTTPDQDLEIVRRLDQLSDLAHPLLIGPSRKSFIGRYLNQPVHDRLAGTAAVICHAIEKKADIIRVHDVQFMKDIAAMCDLMK